MVGLRIKQFAERNGITAYRMAKDTGITSQAFSKFFTGKGEPSAEVLSKIAKTYPSLNIRWLLTGDGEMLEKSAAMEVSVSS